MKIKNIIKYFLRFFVYSFALVGVFLVGGFFAIRLHLTDAAGKIDLSNSYFEKDSGFNQGRDNIVAEDVEVDSGRLTMLQLLERIEKLEIKKELKKKNLCGIQAVGAIAPVNAMKIIEADEMTDREQLTAKMIGGIGLQLKDDQNFQSKIASCDNIPDDGVSDLNILKEQYQQRTGENIFVWANFEEWVSVKQAVAKDKDVINQVSTSVGVEPRMLVACLIGEQLRLFHSQRELFKRVFEPLKILGNANKISLGVMGIKEATAVQIENNLKDGSSPFYLGPELEHVLDYPDGSAGDVRYERLVDESHRYSYLYGSLYLRQIMQQWRDAGYNIQYRPEIVGTLYNVGFPQSKPKANPRVGGSTIMINGSEYSFGRLAYEFYYSGELLEEFPFKID